MKKISGMEVKIPPPVGRTSPEVVEAIVQNTVCVCWVRCVSCFNLLFKQCLPLPRSPLLKLPLSLLHSTYPSFLLVQTTSLTGVSWLCWCRRMFLSVCVCVPLRAGFVLDLVVKQNKSDECMMNTNMTFINTWYLTSSIKCLMFYLNKIC